MMTSATCSSMWLIMCPQRPKKVSTAARSHDISVVGASAVDVLADSLDFLEVKRPGLSRSLARSLLREADDGSSDGRRSLQWSKALFGRAAMSGAKDIYFQMITTKPLLIECLGDQRLIDAFNSKNVLADKATLTDIEAVAQHLDPSE